MITFHVTLIKAFVRVFFVLAHRVHISGAMYEALYRLGGFVMEERGSMTIKVGLMQCHSMPNMLT